MSNLKILYQNNQNDLSADRRFHLKYHYCWLIWRVDQPTDRFGSWLNELGICDFDSFISLLLNKKI